MIGRFTPLGGAPTPPGAPPGASGDRSFGEAPDLRAGRSVVCAPITRSTSAVDECAPLLAPGPAPARWQAWRGLRAGPAPRRRRRRALGLRARLTIGFALAGLIVLARPHRSSPTSWPATSCSTSGESGAVSQALRSTPASSGTSCAIPQSDVGRGSSDGAHRARRASPSSTTTGTWFPRTPGSTRRPCRHRCATPCCPGSSGASASTSAAPLPRRRRLHRRRDDAAYVEVFPMPTSSRTLSVILTSLAGRLGHRHRRRRRPSAPTPAAGSCARCPAWPTRPASWPQGDFDTRLEPESRPRPRPDGHLVQRHGRRRAGPHRARGPLRLGRQPRAALPHHRALGRGRGARRPARRPARAVAEGARRGRQPGAALRPDGARPPGDLARRRRRHRDAPRADAARRLPVARGGPLRLLVPCRCEVATEVAGPAGADRQAPPRADRGQPPRATPRSTAAGPVRIAVEGWGDRVRIVVEDAGPGVPQAEKTRIFERFARGSAARHRVGTGLGLALVVEHAASTAARRGWRTGRAAAPASSSSSRQVGDDADRTIRCGRSPCWPSAW